MSEATFEAISCKFVKTYLHDEHPDKVFIRFDGGEGDVAYVQFGFVEFMEFAEKIADQALKLGRVINEPD